MRTMKDVQEIFDEGLCISCGICAANCPQNCISMQEVGYDVKPLIEEEKCVSCGICAKVCPMNQIAKYHEEESMSDFLLGQQNGIWCAQSKNEDVMANSQSGGVITTLVQALLADGVYTSAFLVDHNDKDGIISTKRFKIGDDLLKTTGSQYLTIVHQNSIDYMIKHPKEKIILVAQGCVVDGIINSIKLHSLERDNYLIIGLFCDKTMNKGVMKYFSQHPACGEGRAIKNIIFRCKDAGGWPGKVRLCLDDGSIEDLPISERGKVKNYFMPERCLYCVDKLNRECDLAVGDNYIKKNADTRGVSSVIVRTSIGRDIWDKYRDKFYVHEDSIDEIKSSQVLNLKIDNYRYAVIKGLYNNRKYTLLDQIKYHKMLKIIKLRDNVHQDILYEKINEHITKENRKNRFKKRIVKLVRIFR